MKNMSKCVKVVDPKESYINFLREKFEMEDSNSNLLSNSSGGHNNHANHTNSN